MMKSRLYLTTLPFLYVPGTLSALVLTILTMLTAQQRVYRLDYCIRLIFSRLGLKWEEWIVNDVTSGVGEAEVDLEKRGSLLFLHLFILNRGNQNLP